MPDGGELRKVKLVETARSSAEDPVPVDDLYQDHNVNDAPVHRRHNPFGPLWDLEVDREIHEDRAALDSVWRMLEGTPLPFSGPLSAPWIYPPHPRGADSFAPRDDGIQFDIIRCDPNIPMPADVPTTESPLDYTVSFIRDLCCLVMCMTHFLFMAMVDVLFDVVDEYSVLCCRFFLAWLATILYDIP